MLSTYDTQMSASADSTSTDVDVGSLIQLPVNQAQSVEMRYALLSSRDCFDPLNWTSVSLKQSQSDSFCFSLDLKSLNLSDGSYEYEFVLDGKVNQPVTDPYAQEITRFGGYRAVFHIKNGARWFCPFSWFDELPQNASLPNNNEIVIYEMPLRWMNYPSGETASLRQIGLGTFDRVIFERLDKLCSLGINTIELLPVQDSADTLNWGYGTRFFFSPDFDMGSAVDLKFFIKSCHQRGIRVILDVVMNHARECPLEELADDSYFLKSRDEEPGRGEDYGARLFRYRRPDSDGRYRAREFHYQAAEYWIRDYHIDGFRLDEFRGIDHWEFIQTYTEKASAVFQDCFPDRPFIVIAEDSWRRPAIVKNQSSNPNGRKVVDAMWNFSFRDELRRLMQNNVHTQWGDPSRQQRVRAMISGNQLWDDMSKTFNDGFYDMAQNVNYITSHDVEAENEQRYFNYCFGHILRERHLSDGNVDAVRYFVDHINSQSLEIQQAHRDALARIRSSYCLLMTSVGMPMLLAGEEFGDCHDLDHNDWRLKMSDPINWRRQQQPGHHSLWKDVKELIELRKSHGALQRNEVDFFYFHPGIDSSYGDRVFAYCRTGNKITGSSNQVITVVNAGPINYPEYRLPWPWRDGHHIEECAIPENGAQPQFSTNDHQLVLSLAPFQVRVFSS